MFAHVSTIEDHQTKIFALVLVNQRTKHTQNISWRGCLITMALGFLINSSSPKYSKAIQLRVISEMNISFLKFYVVF